MLRIRLTRTGRRNQPHYRIIVTEQRSKRDGGYSANLGYYIPHTAPKLLKLDIEEYEEWIKKGAQPTEVVAYLRKNAKHNEEVELPVSTKKKISKKAKAKLLAEKEAAAEAKEENAEAPVEEVADTKEEATEEKES